MSLRLLMMGTGSFAVPAFRGLLESSYTVVGLVTQPDRSGRGHHHHVNPMKELALAAGVPVLQPERASHPEAIEQLRALQADLFVVAAYGQILSSRLLAIPRLGAINLHASLLPKYRGAAPVQYAILNGEQRTGVTIFQIVRELDAGPILGQVETEIGPRETSGELEARLAELALPLTLQVLARLEAGTASAVPQDPQRATFAPRITKEMGQIDWSAPAERIGWHVRAMQPWPMPFTFLHRDLQPAVRLLVQEVCTCPSPPPGTLSGTPGRIVAAPDCRLLVEAGDAIVEILRLRPAGKRAMSAAEFLHGHALPEGARLGPA